MVKQKINIVWLKRDLRLQDHAPLYAAEKHGLPYLIIYIFDSELIRHPDTSLRHLQFIYHSLIDLNNQLKNFNKKVQICYGKSLDIFKAFFDNFEISTIWSYQESGIQKTWDRDKKILNLIIQQQAFWIEFPSNGIIRGIKNRQDWDKKWFSTMNTPLITNTFSYQKEINNNVLFAIPPTFLEKLEVYPSSYQKAGEKAAWKYLGSFTENRGFTYAKHISKPNESRVSCSRISVFLAWGNLSIKQAYQYVKNHKNFTPNKRAFSAFLTRLKWHCHFIQKFEVECSYENICVNKGYELLTRNNNTFLLKSWMDGSTGYPLIDACMKALKNTGWINFRMRAMLVSFLCHHLDQDWKNGAYFLANQFLDYEPGIHYPQFQMQAGTTGINTIRIYNPIKQSMDHDPEGIFIKKWMPTLQKIPKEYIHEPWKMPPLEQEFCNIKIGKDYPTPIVNIIESGKIARKKIYGHGKNHKVKEEKKRILLTHTRNKS
mgnify:CR=1 FL=1